MKKSGILLLFLLLPLAISAQSTTFKNNFGANFINGTFGTFTKSSFSWTITKKGENFVITTNATTQSITVTYQMYDSKNRLYVYRPIKDAYFDGAVISIVMTNEDLSDFAAGKLSDLNLLAIRFEGGTGYAYKLNL